MIDPYNPLSQEGFAIVPDVLSRETCDSLITAMSRLIPISVSKQERIGGIRNLLEISGAVCALAQCDAVRGLITPVLGSEAFAVRAILFDKTPGANWKVPWHQDLTIAVREHHNVEGFNAWTIKADVVHVQPPVRVLENMLSVRIHLDRCDAANGPLLVLPGTHTLGRLNASEILRLRESMMPVACLTDVGGAVLMRPLLLHASSAAKSAAHRRVIHIDFASHALPEGLEWHSANGRENR